MVFEILGSVGTRCLTERPTSQTHRGNRLCEPNASPQKTGFTLVELLVVIAIIAMLVTLLLPAVQAAREAARRSQCSNNLRQLALATLNHESAIGRFPANDNDIARGLRDFASHLVMLAPYMEEANLHDAINFDLPRTSGNQPGYQIVNGRQLKEHALPMLQCPSDDRTGLITPSDAKAWKGLWDGNPVAVTNYAGSIGAQWMESWSGCNLATIVGNGGDRYAQAGDGEDWFNRTRNVPCTRSDGSQANGNVRSDNPCKNAISGVFARSSWAARLVDIEDGTSNTIMMGEIRPYCSVFQWIHGWTLSEGLWFATTPPINFPTCVDGGRGCHDRESSFNTAMGFKSQHPGGAHFSLCDGSARFLGEDIDYTTYQRLGARADAEPVSF